MKKVELDKLQGLKIANQMRQSPHASAPGSSERRERRRREQALGLVPFALKLDGGLVNRLRALALVRGVELNVLVDEVLRKGLGEDKS